jgi:hypothetical protein
MPVDDFDSVINTQPGHILMCKAAKVMKSKNQAELLIFITCVVVILTI